MMDNTSLLLAGFAGEHADATGHDVWLWVGIGWGCETCDPDLFATDATGRGLYGNPANEERDA